jgi:hypothetical protein
MNQPSAFRRLLLLAVPLALLVASSRLPAAESGFSSSPTLSAEAELLMGILNQFDSTAPRSAAATSRRSSPTT